MRQLTMTTRAGSAKAALWKAPWSLHLSASTPLLAIVEIMAAHDCTLILDEDYGGCWLIPTPGVTKPPSPETIRSILFYGL